MILKKIQKQMNNKKRLVTDFLKVWLTFLVQIKKKQQRTLHLIHTLWSHSDLYQGFSSAVFISPSLWIQVHLWKDFRKTQHQDSESSDLVECIQEAINCKQ